MPELNNERQKEVKVEDLLRIKRHERPDDHFWNDFDRELHQRMLRTLVKKDPWYIQLLRAVTGRIAQTTAVGATAAFLALMVLRPAFVETTQPNHGANAANTANAANAANAANTANSSDAASTYAQNFKDTRQLSRQLPEALSATFPAELSPIVVASALESDMTRDYGMEAVTANGESTALGYTSDYAHDSFEVASYDSAAYVADPASFAGSGLATSLVY